jgi:hypothetical protein
MNNKFKIGDKVRCVKGEPFYKLIEGEIYTVSALSWIGFKEPVIKVKELGEQGRGFFEYRFELVTPISSFDLMPDQQVADELRRVRAEQGKYVIELRRRGFLITFPTTNDVKITKTTTTKVEL